MKLFQEKCPPIPKTIRKGKMKEKQRRNNKYFGGYSFKIIRDQQVSTSDSFLNEIETVVPGSFSVIL